MIDENENDCDENDFFSHAINIHFIWKVLHLASFWNWGFLKLSIDLKDIFVTSTFFSSIHSRSKHVYVTKCTLFCKYSSYLYVVGSSHLAFARVHASQIYMTTGCLRVMKYWTCSFLLEEHSSFTPQHRVYFILCNPDRLISTPWTSSSSSSLSSSFSSSQCCVSWARDPKMNVFY